MRRPELFMVVGFLGVLLSALGYLLLPKKQESRWSGRIRTWIWVDIDNLPDAGPVEVFVWDGDNERSLGITNSDGQTAGVVKVFGGGSNHRTVVDLYSERLVLRSRDSGELIKIIPLESCTVHGDGDVTCPIHEVWIDVDYATCESLTDYWR